MKKLVIALTLVCACALRAAPLPYHDGDVALAGEFFARAEGAPDRGGVVLFHQWTGISDHERSVARKLSAQGFAVLCADVYGEGIRPQTPALCMAEVSKYKTNSPLLRARTRAALAALRTAGKVDQGPVVAIGYCFGGTAALELARDGADVKAAVSFHGGLSTPQPAAAGMIRARLLVLHGADDPYTPAAEVKAFESEMSGVGAPYALVQYPGAVHSFTIQSAGTDNAKGAAYNAAADQASWVAFQKLLDQVAPSP